MVNTKRLNMLAITFVSALWIIGVILLCSENDAPQVEYCSTGCCEMVVTPLGSYKYQVDFCSITHNGDEIKESYCDFTYDEVEKFRLDNICNGIHNDKF